MRFSLSLRRNIHEFQRSHFSARYQNSHTVIADYLFITLLSGDHNLQCNSLTRCIMNWHGWCEIFILWFLSISLLLFTFCSEDIPLDNYIGSGNVLGAKERRPHIRDVSLFSCPSRSLRMVHSLRGYLYFNRHFFIYLFYVLSHGLLGVVGVFIYCSSVIPMTITEKRNGWTCWCIKSTIDCCCYCIIVPIVLSLFTFFGCMFLWSPSPIGITALFIASPSSSCM